MRVSTMRKNKIIYSINIEDVQDVALQELDRELTVEELRIVVDKIGDQFDWYEAVASVISIHIEHDESANSSIS